VLKKLSLALVTAISIFPCFAGNFYFGPGISLQDTYAEDSSYRGVNPKFSFGYGQHFNEFWYVGTEANASFGTATLQTGGTNNLKTSNTFGLSLLPGIQLTPDTLAFTRFGLVNSYFNEPDKRQTGGQLGLGLETHLTPSWEVRGEYTYSEYSNMINIGTPKTSAFTFGFVHNFD
jgi:opacity protein-like surface antigen